MHPEKAKRIKRLKQVRKATRHMIPPTKIQSPKTAYNRQQAKLDVKKELREHGIN